MQTRRDASPYVLGQRVFGAIDGCSGNVVSVYGGTFIVLWRDYGVPVVYPENTMMVRRAFPWE